LSNFGNIFIEDHIPYDMQSLVDRSLSVKGEAIVYLYPGGDFTRYDIENLLAKLNKDQRGVCCGILWLIFVDS
jgi:hypothetical protein